MPLEPFGCSGIKKSFFTFPLVHKIKNQILFNVVEYWTSPSTSNSTQTQSSLDSSQISVSAWNRPQLGWSKLNVDGFTKMNLLAARGLIRNDMGEWEIGFCKFIGMETPVMAEAWSLYKGL